jgi:hypothetical protein
MHLACIICRGESGGKWWVSHYSPFGLDLVCGDVVWFWPPFGSRSRQKYSFLGYFTIQLYVGPFLDPLLFNPETVDTHRFSSAPVLVLTACIEIFMPSPCD